LKKLIESSHHLIISSSHHLIASSSHHLICFLLSAFCFLHTFGQSNRLTNEDGQLLWQYNQHIIIDEVQSNRITVHFIFINGNQQTAISLRQELFNSQIEWTDIANFEVRNEERVSSITANLSPHQALVWKYILRNNTKEKELILEKSAILIMNEDYEIRKEIIPEQRFEKR